MLERFHFHRRAQAVEYMADLRKLTTHCQFGAYLNEVLYVIAWPMGFETKESRRSSEADLTLELSLEVEAAEKNAESPKVHGRTCRESHALRHNLATGVV